MNLSLIFLFLCFLLYIQTSISNENYENKICSSLSYTNLFSHVNLKELTTIINKSISSNPPQLNNRNLLDNHVKNYNPCPFREKVLQKMSRNETITVLVMGGSMTEGEGINASIKDEKRWSALLDKYLNSGWYSGSFKVINIARGGWGINHWVERIDEVAKYDPDLIIGDFSVNDSGIVSNIFSIPNYYRTFIILLETLNKKPAVFFNLSLKLADIQANDYYNVYSQEVKINSTKYKSVYRFWMLADNAKIALDEFKVPYASFRDAIYPDFILPPQNLASIWTEGAHPDHITHKYMADFIFNSLFNLITDSIATNKCSLTIKEENEGITLKNPLNFCYKNSYCEPSKLDPLVRPLCLPNTYLAQMEATKQESSKDSFSMSKHFNETFSKWKYFADSKSKFGWIFLSNTIPTNDFLDSSHKFLPHVRIQDLPKEYFLSFEIEAKTSIQISYLNAYGPSYSGFIYWFDHDLSRSNIVRTSWRHMVSIPSTQFIMLQAVQINPNLIPNAHYFLDLTPGMHNLNILPIIDKKANNYKVKILGIRSC